MNSQIPMEPDPGIRKACDACERAELFDVRFQSSGKAIEEKIKRLRELGRLFGWKFEIVDNIARFICPTCAGGPYKALPCPKCGNRKIGSRYCIGAGCDFGMLREHMHRSCQRCGYEWLQETRSTIPVPAPAPVLPSKEFRCSSATP